MSLPQPSMPLKPVKGALAKMPTLKDIIQQPKKSDVRIELARRTLSVFGNASLIIIDDTIKLAALHDTLAIILDILEEQP